MEQVNIFSYFEQIKEKLHEGKLTPQEATDELKRVRQYLYKEERSTMELMAQIRETDRTCESMIFTLNRK